MTNSNAAAFQVQFWLGSGTTYTSGTIQPTWVAATSANRAVGQTNVAAATNNYLQITGLQLEVGTSASPFQFKPYGQELRECQRYYYRAAAINAYTLFSTYAPATSTTVGRAVIVVPVPLRTAPTAVDYVNLLMDDGYSGGAVVNAAPTVKSWSHTTNVILDCPVASGLTTGRAYALLSNNTTNSYVGITADF